MKNRRRLERKRPNQLISVYDVTTGDNLGRLANITTDGIMLVSQKRISVGGVFQLQMVLDDPVNGVDSVGFGAESLWTSAADEEEDYHWTGFQIIDISSESLDFIDDFTKQLNSDSR